MSVEELVLNDYVDLQKELAYLSRELDSVIKNFDVVINQIKQDLTIFEELSKSSDEDLFKEFLKGRDIMPKIDRIYLSIGDIRDNLTRLIIGGPYVYLAPRLRETIKVHDPDLYRRVKALNDKLSSFYSQFFQVEHPEIVSLKEQIYSSLDRMLSEPANFDELLIKYFIEHE